MKEWKSRDTRFNSHAKPIRLSEAVTKITTTPDSSDGILQELIREYPIPESAIIIFKKS